MATKQKKEKAVAKSGDRKVVLKNYTLLKFTDWLTYITRNPGDPDRETKVPFALHGPISRARLHVQREIFDAARAIESERMEIVKKYAKKDEKTGEPIFKQDTQRYDMENDEKFNDEFLALMQKDREFVLDTKQKLADWQLVKDLFVNGLKSEMTVEDTVIYEEICHALEAM